MAISKTHISPPADFTGEAVIAADIKSVGKFPRKDTRVEGATVQWQVQFSLKDTANPIYWDAPSEALADDCIAEINTMIAEQVVIP
jgi:hypothetical protein